MLSKRVILWNVDTQADFMLPGGKLYVPGAEKRIPTMRRLADESRRGRILMVSSADSHLPDDPELRQWPPHCMRGTPGAQIIPETMAEKILRVENRPGVALPESFENVQQIVLEKQALDVFANPNTDAVLGRLEQHFGREVEFVVFGVVTEYCVRMAAAGLLERGRRVAIVTDAIESLDAGAGERVLKELAAQGARRIASEEALQLVGTVARPASESSSTASSDKRSTGGSHRA